MTNPQPKLQEKTILEEKSSLKKFFNKKYLMILLASGITIGAVTKRTPIARAYIENEIENVRTDLIDIIEKDDDIGVVDYFLNSDIVDNQKIEAINETLNETLEKIHNAKDISEMLEIVDQVKNKDEGFIDKLLKEIVLTDNEKAEIKQLLD